MPEEQGTLLHDLILGGQDGLVNVLGITLGISAASSDVHVLIAAGLAATFAEATSMGAVAYTSSMAERDQYMSIKDKKQTEIYQNPEQQRALIAQVYQRKGFEGDLLNQIVSTITKNEKTWLDTAMNEELALKPVDVTAVRRTSLIVTVATVIGSLIPLVPFFFFQRISAIIIAIVVSALALFCVGAYEAKSSIGDWRRSGLQMAAIGLCSAFVGFLAGRLFHSTGS
jgi:VIT1/CCC1 family predicted Fe2+/Mn2+ transporter